MAKREITVGSVDQTIDIFISDTSSTSGEGLTGVVYNSAGLSCYYRVGYNGAATQLNLATQTPTGVHSEGGFAEISSSGMPGLYRLDLSDAMVNTAGITTGMLFGAANMAPVAFEIEVVETDKYDSRFQSAVNSIVEGVVDTGATVTSIPTSSLNPAATVTDQFKGLIVKFDKSTSTAALRGQGTDITGNTAGGTLTVTALTTAPASGDIFTIE